jgi:hypothetical protein
MNSNEMVKLSIHANSPIHNIGMQCGTCIKLPCGYSIETCLSRVKITMGKAQVINYKSINLQTTFCSMKTNSEK